MPKYIQLLTLTPEGREKTMRDPEYVLKAQHAVSIHGLEVLGLYGVLGPYDFVNIVDAPDNEAVARFSIALGVMGGVQILTLPAIPIGRLEEKSSQDAPQERSSVSLPMPDLER